MIFQPFLNESGILFCRKEPGLVTRQPVCYTAFRVTGLCWILIKRDVRNNTIRLDALLNLGISEQVWDLIKPIKPIEPLKQNCRDIHVHTAICGNHVKPYEIRKGRLPVGMGRVSSNWHKFSFVVGYVLVQVLLVEYIQRPVLFLAYGPHFWHAKLDHHRGPIDFRVPKHPQGPWNLERELSDRYWEQAAKCKYKSDKYSQHLRRLCWL